MLPFCEYCNYSLIKYHKFHYDHITKFLEITTLMEQKLLQLNNIDIYKHNETEIIEIIKTRLNILKTNDANNFIYSVILEQIDCAVVKKNNKNRLRYPKNRYIMTLAQKIHKKSTSLY